MAEEIITTVISADGVSQTCVLKEKVNNGNGQLIYRFRNRDIGVEYLLTKEGTGWRSLNPGEIHQPIFHHLCSFAETL
ncbi:hypothetical protein D0C36_23835 [Mucilaginibacter conchicola]|uniref:Uncharacterized protein n=1 Tax=Mucilaginibacter conchicola TaxID=2303333 RepID=A0A372NM24_9SPHI|nr:hypothetical protein [Mucilaginibacter conchicola]RFZ89991.1 hypothetical protein D0C36_23835 [Mucilaginibacter conchicola]